MFDFTGKNRNAEESEEIAVTVDRNHWEQEEIGIV